MILRQFFKKCFLLNIDVLIFDALQINLYPLNHVCCTLLPSPNIAVQCNQIMDFFSYYVTVF